MKKSRLLGAVCACLVLNLFSFSSVAAVIYSAGTGSSVSSVDRVMEFNSGLVEDAPWDGYTENLITLNHPNAIMKCTPGTGCTPPQFSWFDGGFYYWNGLEGEPGTQISATDGAEIYAMELQISHGHGSDTYLADVYGYWEAFDDGFLSGSGTFHVTKGDVVGFSDVNGFDTLFLTASYVPISDFGQQRHAMAMDNIKMQLATSAVPIPAAAWLFGMGLLGLVGLARRKAP